MSPKWKRFFRRAALAGAIFFVVAVAPLPFWTPRWFDLFQVPIGTKIQLLPLLRMLSEAGQEVDANQAVRVAEFEHGLGHPVHFVILWTLNIA